MNDTKYYRSCPLEHNLSIAAFAKQLKKLEILRSCSRLAGINKIFRQLKRFQLTIPTDHNTCSVSAAAAAASKHSNIN